MNTKQTLTPLEGVTALLSMQQQELKQHIQTTVNISTVRDSYLIYSNDNKPKPMLCVHLDTINTHSALNSPIDPSKDFEFDPINNVLGLQEGSKLTCLGADDRAGVWIALEIIKYMENHNDFKYDVGFFLDEEVGCVGSGAFMLHEDFLHCSPTCFIGLDRKSSHGLQEAAVYGNDNKELIAIFAELGYTTSIGSITDAATLSSEHTACINLGVGYDNEHTASEVLYLGCMVETYNVLIGLEDLDRPFKADTDFFYGNDYDYWGRNYGSFDDEDPRESYIEDLELENTVLREALLEAGVNPDDLLGDKL